MSGESNASKCGVALKSDSMCVLRRLIWIRRKMIKPTATIAMTPPTAPPTIAPTLFPTGRLGAGVSEEEAGPVVEVGEPVSLTAAKSK